ncbi:MAG: hypothetical protein FD180_4303 [Planctomycetota bacterium]|nr:MAG: hypothetical protein FD180_4303 [Planctomycetota bacterium]
MDGASDSPAFLGRARSSRVESPSSPYSLSPSESRSSAPFLGRASVFSPIIGAPALSISEAARITGFLPEERSIVRIAAASVPDALVSRDTPERVVSGISSTTLFSASEFRVLATLETGRGLPIIPLSTEPPCERECCCCPCCCPNRISAAESSAHPDFAKKLDPSWG